MIALDTNVIVRFLVQDDPQQSAEAGAIIARITPDTPGFLTREVMVELVWVLERAYRLPRSDIAASVDGLLSSHELVVEAANRVGLAIERYRHGGAGFSDHMIALSARDSGCTVIYSFDRKAVSQAGMTQAAASN